MKQRILTFCSVSFVLMFVGALGICAQQPAMGEKEKLVLKFRQLTGADKVNLGMNVDFADTKAP